MPAGGVRIVIVQLLSCVWLFVTPMTAARQASLSFTISRSLLRLMSVESVMQSISSSATLFFCFQSYPASGSFSVSRLFASSGQGIGASASVLPMNIQGWFPLGLTGLILQSKGLSRVFSSTTVWKHQFFGVQPSLWSNLHIHTWLLESLTIGIFVSKVISLLFNMLSIFVIDFLPRIKCFLITT